MNILTIALTILSLSASQLAFTGNKPRRSEGWSQSDMEMWEEFGRWRRAHQRDRRPNYDNDRNDKRDYDNERNEKNRGRWDDDNRNNHNRRDRSDRRGREDRDNSAKPYPPEMIPEPQQPPKLNPLPIIIEPIRPMPSIIEPYPVVEETSATKEQATYPLTSSGSYYSQTTEYNAVTSSSVYYTSKPAVVTGSKKYPPLAASNSSTSYGSTAIVTVPESTVTTKVTGRYRAMSNSAASSNVAGTISFALVLFSSLFLLVLV